MPYLSTWASWAERHDLSSLRLLGSVGEPINPEAWKWYYQIIGQNRCPIMDTWWQTETGGFMITPLPITPLKPGSATKPFFGIDADVVDEEDHAHQQYDTDQHDQQNRTATVALAA